MFWLRNQRLISNYALLSRGLVQVSDVSYFLACADFRRLLVTFANSLDPDQDGQNVGPGLGDPNRKSIFKKVCRYQQKPEQLPSEQRVNKSIGHL